MYKRRRFSKTKLSEEKVIAIAKEYAKSIGWGDANQHRLLYNAIQDKTLVWRVEFTETENNLPLRGGTFVC